MRISTNQFNTMNVNSILDAQLALAKLDKQMVTQNKINHASDDPIAASMILKLNQNLSNIQSYGDNANFAKTRLSMEDTILQAVHDTILKVRTLAVKSNNDTLSHTDREDIAKQMQLLLSQLVDLANTKDGTGEYIFAGFFGGNIPFSYDPSGKVVYNGSAGQRYLQIGTATHVAITDSGHDIFQEIKNGNGTFVTSASNTNTGSGIINPGLVVVPGTVLSLDYTISFLNDPSTGDFQYTVTDSLGNIIVAPTHFTSESQMSFAGISVAVNGTPEVGDTFVISPSVNQSIFTTVQNCIAALNEPNSAVRASKIATCLQELDNSDNNLGVILSSIGARVNTIQNELTQNSALSLTTTENISDLQNVDMAQIISELTQQTVSLQAAYLVYAKIGNMSLFNYMGQS